MSLRVVALALDDGIVDKLAQRGINPRDLRDVIASRPVVRRNRRRQGRIELVGATRAGRILLVALDSTPDTGTWRPVTAYDAEPRDRKLYRP